VWPRTLSCDNEYKAQQFIEATEKHGTQIRYSQPDQPNKNAVVERVIR
jgi:hypothetical protein